MSASGAGLFPLPPSLPMSLMTGRKRRGVLTQIIFIFPLPLSCCILCGDGKKGAGQRPFIYAFSPDHFEAASSLNTAAER